VHVFYGTFLVSNNIPYECVLGWDFFSQNNLSLCKDVNLRNYVLVGKHAATPITNSQSSTTADRAGAVESTPQSVQVDSPVGRLLCQSRFQGNTGVFWWRVYNSPTNRNYFRGVIGETCQKSHRYDRATF
jgi:hypothetical protein